MTNTQFRALAFLDRYQAVEGFPATRRELCVHMGWSAPSTAQGIIDRLEAQGLVERARFGVVRVTLLGKSTLNAERLAA